MQRSYYVGNRERLYQRMDAGSLLAVFSGEELWKTGDEYYARRLWKRREVQHPIRLKSNPAVSCDEKESAILCLSAFSHFKVEMNRRSIASQFDILTVASKSSAQYCARQARLSKIPEKKPSANGYFLIHTRISPGSRLAQL